jgi:hypothetical protein
LRVVRDALRVNLFPLQPLLAEFDRFRNGVACRSAWTGRKIQLEIMSSIFLELLRVASDLRGETAAEYACELPHSVVQIGSGAGHHSFGRRASAYRFRLTVPAQNVCTSIAHCNYIKRL